MTQSIRLKRLTAVKPEAQAISRLEQNVDQAVRDVDEAKVDRPVVRGLVTSDYRAKVGDFVPFNPEAGAFAIFLPKPSGNENGREILCVNITATTTSIEYTGVDCLLDGAAVQSFGGAYATRRWVAFNGDWYSA